MSMHPDDSAPFSLESMIDTLTCVVGVLIVILAATQLLVLQESRAVAAAEAMAATDAEASEGLEERFVLLEQEHAQARAVLEALRARWPEARQLEYDEEASRVRELAESILAVRDLALAGEDVVELSESVEERLGLLKEERAELEPRLAEAQAMLDRLVVEFEALDRATELALPELRKSDRELTPVRFFVRAGRVYPFDVDALSEAFENARKHVLRTVGANADYNDLIRYCDDNAIGDKYVLLDIYQIPDRRNRTIGLQIKFKPRTQQQGQPADELGDPDGVFANVVSGLDPEQQYAEYVVWADSFDTYLAASRLAEQFHATPDTEQTRLASNWAPYDLDEEYTSVIRFGEAQHTDNATEILVPVAP